MVREFKFDTDYVTICKWWLAHKKYTIPVEMLPTYGLIVPNIAAGFLIVTDCDLALLEYYVTNPKSDKKERDLALDLITNRLIKYGESIGVNNFKADTQIKAIKDRAEKFGFRNIGQYTNLVLSTKKMGAVWAV